MSYFLCTGKKSDELQGEYRLNMDVIYSGWLVKSPPEKKTQNHWLGKIFQAKWRRRYFVLAAPPASSSLPGSYELVYYESQHMRRKHGQIDVDQCEEIVATLDSAHYQHLFALRTKHRTRDRTYYLAASTEEDMNRWVDCLCKVCGFKQDPSADEGAIGSTNAGMVEETWSSPPAPIVTNVHTTVGAIRSDAASIHSQSSSRQDLPPRRASTGDSYIPLEECFSDGHGGQSPLDQVPPAPSQHLRASQTSIPDMMAPPPPMKTNNRNEDQGFDPFQTYDHPSKSYVNVDSVDNDDGTYKVPPRRKPPIEPDENLYKMPPVRHMEFVDKNQSPTGEMEYDYPASVRMVTKQNSQRDSNSSSGSRASQKQDSAYGSEDAFYDQLPRKSESAVTSPEHMAQRIRCTTLTADDCYDVPPARKTQSETNILDRVPPPPRPPRSSAVPPGPTVPYMNIPSLNGQQAPSVIGPERAVSAAEQMYDFPKRKPSDADILTMSPPPPKPCSAMTHGYVNAPDGVMPGQHESMYLPMDQNTSSDLYLPMQQATQDSLYTDMSGVRAVYVAPNNCQPKSYSAAPGTKPPRLQSLRAKVMAAEPAVDREDTYAIYSTHRTRSFKRHINCPGRPEVPLPVKRAGVQDDSSSDEGDSDSVDSHTNSTIENAPLKAVQSSDVSAAALPNKKHLNSTPPPPNRPGEIQYLELALEDSEELNRDRSPMASRSVSRSTQPGNVSPTDYREIDLVKTKALCHLKQDIQSVRRNSERSLDE